MNFSEIIKLFIESKQEYLIQAQGYEKDLLIFWNFLKTKNVDDESWPYFLGGANTELILESLKFYIKENKINSISTGSRFISVLVEFFQFIIDKKIIQNKELYEEMNSPIYSTRSFRARINSWISQNLKDKEGSAIFSQSEIVRLIHDCNEILNMRMMNDEVFEKKIVPALILKLVVLTGVKYKIVRSLSINDLNLRYGTIEINRYVIHLPHSLVDQFELYVSLRNEKANSDYLFIQLSGEQLPDKTGNTAYFLGSLTTRTDLTGIIKFAIVEMINKGIGESIIKEFTGVGKTIFEDCLNLINKDIHKDRNIFLDSRIRELFSFNKM
ncbi:hypothetical protein J40TS1_31760 [Paenibacillus montaniterrae]|uniref:Uncharacterized protein n=2 Tax=Paenibacillus montaniterrae TaxID=429341 RepID=A0A919YSH4_9BACL|nr:hypothetical protein J40TS1_31760 [Paenibacillus montaniterrae]